MVAVNAATIFKNYFFTMENIANRTAEAILEESIVVRLAGKEYSAKRPTLATLIEVSKLLSQLPNTEVFNVENMTNEKMIDAHKKGLFYAKECGIVGLILATFILGYDKRSNGFFSRIGASNYERKRMRLSLRLMNSCTVNELITEFQKLLIGLDAASFFVFIASLSAINLMSEAMTTTPSGR